MKISWARSLMPKRRERLRRGRGGVGIERKGSGDDSGGIIIQSLRAEDRGG